MKKHFHFVNPEARFPKMGDRVILTRINDGKMESVETVAAIRVLSDKYGVPTYVETANSIYEMA